MPNNEPIYASSSLLLLAIFLIPHYLHPFTTPPPPPAFLLSLLCYDDSRHLKSHFIATILNKQMCCFASIPFPTYEGHVFHVFPHFWYQQVQAHMRKEIPTHFSSCPYSWYSRAATPRYTDHTFCSNSYSNIRRNGLLQTI